MSRYLEWPVATALLALSGVMVGPPLYDCLETSDLPPAVAGRADEQFPGGEIRRVETSVREGVTVYTLHVHHEGQASTLWVTPGGRMLNIARASNVGCDGEPESGAEGVPGDTALSTASPTPASLDTRSRLQE